MKQGFHPCNSSSNPIAMNFVMVHYHLDPGGVTRVIERASYTFHAAGIPHVILAGGNPGNHPSKPNVHYLAGLSYQDSGNRKDAITLLDRMRAVTRSHFGSAPVAWWFHNHALGKNPLVPEVVRLLADSGERLILHIHDLIENGRPHNLPRVIERGFLYPVAPRIHYVFLNSRDRNVFINAGLPGNQARLIANLTVAQQSAVGNPDAPPAPVVFYPVRGIRRKNLGELLMIALLAPTGIRFAVSRSPDNPGDRAHHDFWVRQAMLHSLPVDFAVSGRLPPPGGVDPSFESWATASTHRLTTSIEEGFGLTLFEAIADRKPVIGRRLSNIADQIPRNLTDHLYDHLLVPSSWVDSERLRRTLSHCLSSIANAWGHSFDPDFPEEVMGYLNRSDHLDFGNLPEAIQAELVTRCMDPEVQSEVLIEQSGHRVPAKLWLEEILARGTPSRGTRMREHVTADDWLESVSEILKEVEAAASTEVTWITPDRVLAPFLEAAHFHFLKSP
jgi:hypothetical protein